MIEKARSEWTSQIIASAKATREEVVELLGSYHRESVNATRSVERHIMALQGTVEGLSEALENTETRNLRRTQKALIRESITDLEKDGLEIKHLKKQLQGLRRKAVVIGGGIVVVVQVISEVLHRLR
jgi:transposase